MVCRVLRGFYRFLVVQISKSSCLTWVSFFFWGSEPFLLDFHVGFHTPCSQLLVFYIGVRSVPHRLSCFYGGFGNVLDSNA